MGIAPLSGPLGLGPASPRPDEAERTAAAGSTVGMSSPRPATATQTLAAVRPVQPGSDLEQLKKVISDERLELHLQSLPDSSVAVMRIIEPSTGDVVREFPPEGLAEALAELRKRAASHIDKQA